MSKIAKKPVEIKEGVNVALDGKIVKVSGPKGELTFSLPQDIRVKAEAGFIHVAYKEQVDEASALAGLTRSIISNMIRGVASGFEKKLELSGVGYRAQAADNSLTLSVGFSHPVKITAGEGIHFSVEENVITVSGIDKELVGNTAARIRSIRPPEPYKGKGIKYVGERIRRKVGKAAKAVGAK
jgi:large subunit ribosomal protein L6